MSAVLFMALLVLAVPAVAVADDDLAQIPEIPAHIVTARAGQYQTPLPVQLVQNNVEPPPAIGPAPEIGPAVVELDDIPGGLIQAVQAKKARRAAPRTSQTSVASSETVKIAPGRNVVTVVAGNNLNRIVTPFEHPVVNTVSNAKLKVDGSIIYVSLGLVDGATTLFITEEGEPEPALSMTLMPQAVPPREIRLVLEGGWPVRSGGNGKAAKWEKNEPYLEAISEVIMRTAKGELPQGYNLRRPTYQDPIPACSPSVEVQPGQVLEGHNLIVIVCRLTNRTSGQLLIDEAAFYRPGVRAVAVWPKVKLSGRESTELYVVFGRDAVSPPKARPSVLTSGWLGNQPSESAEEPRPYRQPTPEPEPADTMRDVLASRMAP